MSRDIFHQTKLLRAPSNLALNTAREGAATASLGSLGQSLTTLMARNCFPISNLNLPCSSPLRHSAGLERCRGCLAHMGPHALPSLSHGAPAHPRGSQLPLAAPQLKASSASEGLLHPSPGGTCAEFASTAIPRELQNKPEAPADIYAGFSSSVRNRAPSVCFRLRDSYKFFSFSYKYIFFFFFSFESTNLSEEIMT